MRVWLVSDHAGYVLKNHLRAYLANQYEVVDEGAFSDESTDYPAWVHKLMQTFDPSERAILMCGTGNGVCMTANRYPQVRAALAWNVEIARLARAHNDANVLCLPARFISPSEAEAIVVAFLTTTFEGGRHERRINQINPSAYR